MTIAPPTLRTGLWKVAVFALFLSTPAAAKEMQFSVDRSEIEEAVRLIHGGGFQIFASGEIDKDAGKRLRSFAKENGIEEAAVVFDSPGGSLLGGLNLGTSIRELGFDTKIGAKGKPTAAAVCASACAYAFAGGNALVVFDDRRGDVPDPSLVRQVDNPQKESTNGRK